MKSEENLASPSDDRNEFEKLWNAKTADQRTDLLRADQMLQRIDYLEQLRSKLLADIEFGDEFTTSELSTLDTTQLLEIVEREITHLGASVQRLVGKGDPRMFA